MIYPLLLDGEDQKEYYSNGYMRLEPPHRFEFKVQGLFLPFSYWRFPYLGNTDDPYKQAMKRTNPLTLMHASPPILCVNKQIREEAKSLFLSQYLVLELHGVGCEPQDKLKSFRYWLMMLKTSEIATIQRIELRENVHVVRPDDVPMVRLWDEKQVKSSVTARGFREYWMNKAWRGEMSAFDISIEEGRVVEVWSRVEIAQCQRQLVQSYMKKVAESKTTDRAFTGQDLVELVCWMKTTALITCGVHWISCGVEKYRPRWKMYGTEEEIDCYGMDKFGWGTPRKIKVGFRHLLARVKVGETLD